MENSKAIVLYNRTTSNDNDTHAYMIQKEREKLSIIPMFPIGIKSSVKYVENQDEGKNRYGETFVEKMAAELRKYNLAVEKLKETAKVQGGSFSLNPPKPNKALQLESKIPEKCKGKDACHDFRLCKLCLPYWKKFNKLNSDAVKEENVDEKESEEEVGIDAEDPGYEEAYKVSSEEEEASGYDW